MGEPADQEMSVHPGENAHKDAPNYPIPAAESVKEHSPRDLVKHPIFLHELVDRILLDIAVKQGRMSELYRAAHLPVRVDEDRALLSVIIVAFAFRLSLSPVAEIVSPHHPERASDAHQRSEMHQEIFEPLRALKPVVDKLPVHPKRMAEQNAHPGADEENREVS